MMRTKARWWVVLGLLAPLCCLGLAAHGDAGCGPFVAGIFRQEDEAQKEREELERLNVALGQKVEELAALEKKLATTKAELAALRERVEAAERKAATTDGKR